MILRSLQTENFRNLAPAEHAFHPSANIIVGRNGQGKTNLLEAIYFLATTKSFRTTRIASLPRFGSTSVFASGRVESEGLQRTHSAGLETGETRRRVLMINGEKVTLAAYVASMTVFAYSQSRLDLIRGTPDDRRRFIDRGVATLHPGHVDALSRYTRVLRQRNALLHAIASREANASTLDAWNDEFIEAGLAVTRARASYLRDLAVAYDEVVADHRYHVTSLATSYTGITGEAALREELQRVRAHELRAGMSLIGPQRDHLELTIDGRAASEVLSGGEQKMVVLFFKMAKVDLFHRRTGQQPLFLLDDVDAELDLEILQKLLSILPAKTQVFATSAKESFLEALSAGAHRRLTIENGHVTATHDFA